MRAWLELIQICEQEIRAGQTGAAARRLAPISLKKVPRTHRLALARLCRRTGHVAAGLRLLTPIVRPVQPVHPQASPDEIAEYALLLQRAGPVSEALTLLSRLDPRAVPQAALYEAYCLFNDWEYERAIPRLELFLSLTGDPYEKLIGEVNLASALIAVERLDEARASLEKAQVAAAKAGAVRLLRNCHEMRAQIAVQQGKWSEAEAHLNLALSPAHAPVTLDQLYARKWQAVLQSRREGRLDPLLEFRALALVAGDAESVRDTDLLLLMRDFEQEKFQFLYFGTPFAPYRRRLERLFGVCPDATSYTLNPDGDRALDLSAGKLDGEMELPALGAALLRALCSDFYRPRVTGSLFSRLYPGEHFDIATSPARVHQALRRTRGLLKAAGLPARILCEQEAYRLQAGPNLKLIVPAGLHAESPDEKNLIRLASRFPGGESFTAVQARTVLGLSPYQFKQWAAWARESGRLRRFGAGPSTTYYFDEQSHAAPAKRRA